MTQTLLKKHLLDYQKGDPAGFESFFSATQKFVYNLIRMRVRNVADQEEIFQNVFFRVHSYVHTYDENFNPITWLSRICQNATFDYLKARRSKSFESFDENTVSAPPPESENRSTLNELIEHCFGELTEDEKKLVIDKIVHDMDYKDLSLASNTTEQSLRKKMSRILQKARVKLKKEGI